MNPTEGTLPVTAPHPLVLHGVSLESWSLGEGEPLLILHDIEYLNEPRPFWHLLAGDFSIVGPSHPGFGSSDLPAGFDSVDDLAYLYLDLLEAVGPMHVMGMGFGGWVAAEVAVRCPHNLRSLVLVDAVGIKTAGRETAEIADTFVMDPGRFLECSWHDSDLAKQHMKLPGLGPMPEAELAVLLRNREAAALFGWNPFMHSPKLPGRLGRITVPTLVVWGESDGVVNPEYGRSYARAIPNARFETLPQAGHYPYLEQPERFVNLVASFLKRG